MMLIHFLRRVRIAPVVPCVLAEPFLPHIAHFANVVAYPCFCHLLSSPQKADHPVRRFPHRTRKPCGTRKCCTWIYNYITLIIEEIKINILNNPYVYHFYNIDKKDNFIILRKDLRKDDYNE